FFYFLPDREGINQNGFTRERRDVEVAAPGLFNVSAETGRDLEPSLLIHGSRCVPTQHRCWSLKSQEYTDLATFGHYRLRCTIGAVKQKIRGGEKTERALCFSHAGGVRGN